MDLKYALQGINSDLAYLAQASTSLARQVTSVKSKADLAIAAGWVDADLTLDGAFFLSRELFDLDTTYLGYINDGLDIAVDRLKRLHSTPFGNATPTIRGPYYRGWLTNARVVVVTNIDLSSPGTAHDGVTLSASDRVLLVSQTDPKENGVYTVGTPWAKTSDNLEFACIKISEGTKYANTVWWNQKRWALNYWDEPSFLPMREYTEVGVLTGDALQAAKSHRINSTDFYTLVLNVATFTTALKSAVTSFKSAVDTLKSQTTASTVSSNAATALTAKASLDTAIANFETDLNALELMAGFFQGVVLSDGYWSSEDQLSMSRSGFQGQPHKPFDVAVLQATADKTYNNNFTKALGDGSGGTSTGGNSMTGSSASATDRMVQAMHNANAINEYWAQVGFRAAERATNWKQYLELLDQDMIDMGLEEIITMHDKAVKDTYDKETSLPTGFLAPVAPKPVAKASRETRDKTLPYTDAEIEELDP